MTPHEINRRTFLKQTGATAGLAGIGLVPAAGLDDRAGGAPSVALLSVTDDAVASAPSALWALGRLQESLTARGVAARVCRQMSDVAVDDVCVVAGGSGAGMARVLLDGAGVKMPAASEALALVSSSAGGRAVILASGGDARGLTYALLELSDRVTHANQPLSGLEVRQPVVEKPSNPIRSVTRLFASDVEDKSWYNDRTFWQNYLTELATHRFNRFSLTLGLGYDFTTDILDCYFHFAYPFLLSLPGANVRAVGLPDAERDKNLEMLRFISEEAKTRGLHFQLGLWTHAYQWTRSPNANYTISGLTPETHANYCRDALRTLLQACPAISGVTFRIHGESGVAEGSLDFWKTVFDGVAKCGRSVEIDLHAKGIEQNVIDAALATGMPVNVSPKFWAEHLGLPYHQGRIRELEMPPRNQRDQGFFGLSNGSRRFLRYGYGDLLTENRRYGVFYRVWPGTQRMLLWGSPAMAAGYGRAANFCGCLGMELCEPMSFKGRKGSGRPGRRTGYADESLEPKQGDWEKYRYTCRLWGRLLYNPDAEPDTWQRALRTQYGAGAEAAESALAHASRILPLVTTAHLPSAANNNYWPEVYTNMSIVDATVQHPYGDSPQPRRFGTVSPIDPELFARIDDFAASLVKGELTGQYSPLEVAQWLLDLAEKAGKQLAEAEGRVADARNPEFRRLAIDVAIQCGLGRFFAHKFRSGVLYALYEHSKDRAALEQAVKAYRAARDAWAELSKRADGVYVRDLTYGMVRNLRGHWLDRLPAIDQDIERMERRGADQGAPQGDPAALKRALQAALATPVRPSVPCQHTPPAVFRPGEAVGVELGIGKVEDRERPTGIRLHFRHVNQGETFQVVDMKAQDGRWQAAVPAGYSQSPFPLQYYFELRDASGQAWMFPGLGNNLCDQPYYVVRQAK